MRHEYETTFLTKDTLEDNVKAIADEMGLSSGRYLYKILSGEQTDPYAPFRHLFRAIARVRPEQALLYLKDLRSLVPAEDKKRSTLAPVNDGLLELHKAYLELTGAVGEDREELKKRVEQIVSKGNKLLMTLDPPRPMVTGIDEKRRGVR